MINRVMTFLKRHKICFGIILLLPLYHMSVVGGMGMFAVKEINYTFHCVDFSMGFCSRLLPGSIYRLLVGIYTRQAVSYYIIAVYLVFLIMLAVLLEHFVLRFPAQRRACLTLIIFFLTGPLTINIFVLQLGMLDFYWALFFLMACLCLEHKYLRFAVPVLVVLMIMTYYASSFTYVVTLLFIIFLYFFKAQEKKEKTVFMILFSISLLLTVALSLYFIKNDTNNLVYNVKEFTKIMKNERNASPAYYDYSFYNFFGPEYKGTRLYDAYRLGFIGKDVLNNKNIFQAISIRFKTFEYFTSTSALLTTFAVGLIPQAFLVYVLAGYIKKEKKRIKRLFAVAFIITDVAMELVGSLFSNDTPRWVGHAVMMLFAFVMYLICLDYKEGIDRIDRLFKKFRYSLVWVFLFFYSFIIMEPFTMQI